MNRPHPSRAASGPIAPPSLRFLPPVSGPAETTERIMVLAEEITRLLVSLAPEYSNVDGIAWRVTDGTPNGLWASGTVQPRHERMNFRPEHFNGWRVAHGAVTIKQMRGL